MSRNKDNDQIPDDELIQIFICHHGNDVFEYGYCPRVREFDPRFDPTPEQEDAYWEKQQRRNQKQGEY